jgi:hypothetical protein
VRFETKRDAYIKEIFERIERVGEERAYRIVGILEETANKLEQDIVPRIRRFLQSRRRKILWLDGIIFGGLAVLFLVATIWGGYWDGFSLKLPHLDKLPGGNYTLFGLLGILALGVVYIHFTVRRWLSNSIALKLLKEIKDSESHPNYAKTFRKNSTWYRSIFNRQPVGWNKRTQRRLAKILDNTNAYIQKLNDMYTNPSGDKTFIPVAGTQTCGEEQVSNPAEDNPGHIDQDATDETKTEQ